MWLLRLLFKPLGFVLAGLVVAAIGSAMYWNGTNGKPLERAELTQVEGTVQKVMMTWKEKYGSKRNIKFEVDVKTADGQITQFILPDEQITEDQASEIDGSTIKALVEGAKGKDVWELIADDTTVISYETTRQRRIESLAFQASSGPYIGGGGMLLFLVGLLRLSRRRRENVQTV